MERRNRQKFAMDVVFYYKIDNFTQILKWLMKDNAIYLNVETMLNSCN